MIAAMADRFWSKVQKTDGCWEWQGGHFTHGYGRAWDGERQVLAHRLAFVLASGAIPDGMHVLHKCDVPLCVNPEHLFLGTHADNMADCGEKGRRRNPIAEQRRAKTHCPAGHEYSESNTYRQRDGSRVCRACDNVRCRTYRERHRIATGTA